MRVECHAGVTDGSVFPYDLRRHVCTHDVHEYTSAAGVSPDESTNVEDSPVNDHPRPPVQDLDRIRRRRWWDRGREVGRLFYTPPVSILGQGRPEGVSAMAVSVPRRFVLAAYK